MCGRLGEVPTGTEAIEKKRVVETREEKSEKSKNRARGWDKRGRSEFTIANFLFCICANV